MKKSEIEKKVIEVYEWFNKISNPNEVFDKRDLLQKFANDFIMRLNDKVIVDGIEELYEHFEKFRKSGYKLDVVLPLQDIVISLEDKKCVAKYNIFKYKNKEKINIKVIAIWHLNYDYKMTMMDEVVYGL